MSRVPLSLLLYGIQPAKGHGGWHGGPTPSGALRGVTADQARWSPAPRRKSIWALALHVTYWKYAVRRLLEGGERGAFPRGPSNWPEPPDRPDSAAWAADVALLRQEHARLLAAAARVNPRWLDRRPSGSRRWTYGDLLIGIAAHDAYHTGQIQLMKRLWQERSALVRGR
jgi:uncharacterized damage-inducible protein DinB